MRLLRYNKATGYSFHDVLEASTVKYAIVSHRWYEDGRDVLYDDITNQYEPSAIAKDGWRKLKYAREQAEKDELEYFWIDTCCIDKRNSAELSEAINSMYYWYQTAQVCYAYIWDVDGTLPELVDCDADTMDEESPLKHFLKSIWFTRGWTLQELIAPIQVRFYGADWNFLGTAKSLAQPIARQTRVAPSMLEGTSKLSQFSIAQRMSWAANRTTSRIEDRAYSLLGVFDINMPMLYGERHKAFLRLQEEIIRYSSDQSIFAWYPNSSVDQSPGHLLATSPADFAQCSAITFDGGSLQTNPSFTLTNRGLQGEFPALEMEDGRLVLALNCQLRDCYIGLNVACYSADQWRREHATVTPVSGPTPPASRARDYYLALNKPPHNKDTYFAVTVARYDRSHLPKDQDVLIMHESVHEARTRVVLLDHAPLFFWAPHRILISRHVDDTRWFWGPVTLFIRLPEAWQRGPRLSIVNSYPGPASIHQGYRGMPNSTTGHLSIKMGQHYVGALKLMVDGSDKVLHLAYMVHRLNLLPDKSGSRSWFGAVLIRQVPKHTVDLQASAEVARGPALPTQQFDGYYATASFYCERAFTLHAKLQACNAPEHYNTGNMLLELDLQPDEPSMLRRIIKRS